MRSFVAPVVPAVLALSVAVAAVGCAPPPDAPEADVADAPDVDAAVDPEVDPAAGTVPTHAAGSGPDDVVGRDVAAEAIRRTLEADTGRFRVELEVGAATGPQARVARTSVVGAFDRPRRATDATVDLASLADSVPEVADRVPPGLRVDTLRVRTIDGQAWARAGSEGRWTPVPVDHASTELLGGIGAPRDLLSLVQVAIDDDDAPFVADGGGGYRGHIGQDAVLARGAPADVAGIAGALPAGLGRRFLRYELRLGPDALVRSLVLELDMEALAAAAGEPARADEGVFRTEVRFAGLGEPVDIAAPMRGTGEGPPS